MKVKDARTLFIYKSAIGVLEGVYGDNESLKGDELIKAFEGAGIELSPLQEKTITSICKEIVEEIDEMVQA